MLPPRASRESVPLVNIIYSIARRGGSTKRGMGHTRMRGGAHSEGGGG